MITPAVAMAVQNLVKIVLGASLQIHEIYQSCDFWYFPFPFIFTGVSIACSAEPCISHRQAVCLSVDQSVCHMQALCQNDAG